MDLIIVESPTKAKTLSRFLGKDYLVDSTMGHVRDLPKSTLGVDVKHDFAPEYVDVAKRQDVVARIKKEAQKADNIFLATDPDREGEAIAYHVAWLLKNSRKNPTFQRSNVPALQRIVFHEITESAVKHAIENAGDINMPLVHAQQARRVLDRLVGYKLSPLLWRKVRKGLSAGRVQSVTVKLIVEKEREIEAFKSEEYWEVFCEVASKSSKLQAKSFLVRLIKINDEKAEVKNEKQADKIVTDLEKANYVVYSIEQKELTKRPYAPFTTSTMAQAASRIFFWSAKKTMSVAQRLYEEGLITYHRTDSTNLAVEAIGKVRQFIQLNYGNQYVPEKPRFYKTTSRVAQEAHEAIRPTNVGLDTESIKQKTDRDGTALYGLIWKRFVSCQMADSLSDQTTINVLADKYLLQAQGDVIKFDGWKKLYGNKLDEEQELPEVKEGEILQLIKVEPQQKFTEPPARYTEATLVKTLEKLGIGRPSTYAPTISTIQVRQYVEKKEGKFFPTTLGIAVNDFLVKYFPGIDDYKFTSDMEDDLDHIANGKKEWVPIIREFWSPFNKKLSGVEKNAKRVEVETEKTGKKCPKCGKGDEVIRIGRFGKFLSCSRFPECDYTANYIETLNMKCPGCGKGDVVVRKTRKGKSFYGCSRYPDCKWASWRKPGSNK